MDRMTPLDAAFLQAEDEEPGVSLAICSVAVFEGPPPSTEEFAELLRGRLPLIPRYRQKVRADPVRPRATGVGGRRALRPRLPPAPDRAARPRARRRAVGADRPGDGRPAGPWPAAVGVLAGRAAARRPLGADLQGAPLHGRRRLRHRPVRGGARPDADPAPPEPDDWRPEPEPTNLALRPARSPAWPPTRSRRSVPRPAPSASPASSWAGRGTPRADWPRCPARSCRPAAPRSPGR